MRRELEDSVVLTDQRSRGWQGTTPTAWAERGISRRSFIKFCSAMATALALPELYVPQIAAALEKMKRPALVWLEFQDCAGCTESFLRASHPPVGDIVLDILSVNYHETIMAPSGKAAERSLMDTVRGEKGKYLVVVEGSIPTKDGGIYCTIGGRTALDIVREVCGNAAATITVGACAFYGGWPSARPDPTGAVGVEQAVPGITIVNLPGCPPNAANITATVVHYLTFGELPPTDEQGRPLFAYGELIHDRCERRAHLTPGDTWKRGATKPIARGSASTRWDAKGRELPQLPGGPLERRDQLAVGGGHGCIGCAERNFWDTMSPFYRQLPRVPGFGIQTTADEIGGWIVGWTAAAFAAHGVVSAIRSSLQPLDGKNNSGRKEEDVDGENRRSIRSRGSRATCGSRPRSAGARSADAWSSSTMFRGMESVLRDRDPRDAWLFAQRI